MMSEQTDRPTCHIDLPYPGLKCVTPNLTYARILLNDYAGSISELTAIMQYLYGQIQLKEEYPEISTLLMCISKTEMHHMALLGEAILSLGGDPQYRVMNARNMPSYWSAQPLNYSKTAKKILIDSIAGEIKAIDQYEKHIQLIEDENIQALLKRIIMDEELHIKDMTEALDRFC